jgi:hypothetical protein
MASCNWQISGPENFWWTPVEVAQIARAAQAFQDALPKASKNVVHFVMINNVGVLDGHVVVDWLQPGEPQPEDDA